MNLEHIDKFLNGSQNIAHTLGMKFISTDDENTCVASMKVSESIGQTFGYLSGGATIAMAETLAGVGSSVLCINHLCVGINVSASHVKSVPIGETVTGYARLIHKGATLHQWQVDVKNNAGEIISCVQVTNYIKKQFNG